MHKNQWGDHAQPGIYHGVDIRDYHASKALSKSGIDDLARSPAIFRALRGPDAPGRKETASQLHGNLAHCAILEPDAYYERYEVHPAMNRNTNAWKERAASAAETGKTAIQQDQHDDAMRQAASVSKLTNVYRGLSMAEILAHGMPEVSALWKDETTGVMCRCRPDWVCDLDDGSVLLLDVKTFSDATPRAFGKQVGRMRYHVQDAFYSLGYDAASDQRVSAFIFLAVEDKFPFAAATYQLGEETRYEGLADARAHIDLFKQCQETGIWPGYATSTGVIDLPPYMLSSQDIEIEYE